MKALSFWKAVTMDKANLLDEVQALLEEHSIRFCVIGGQAVDAYVEPLVSLDLDLVVAVDQVDRIRNPRWSPENRPYVVTSKAANEANPEQEYLYLA
jgi:hypothetical protein